ncbi:MAG: response regulator transcription factor [Lachnospiraceae bacterium]|nr:response regulator transcription factor [Lachnospiraceae bacterium]
MIRIGIAEDQDAEAQILIEYLQQYEKEKQVPMRIDRYKDGDELEHLYHQDTDLLLLDIEMPGMTGLEAAREIREIDERVMMIFVTNLAQFALKGYEVQAMDYILKPISYSQLELRLNRVMRALKKRTDCEIVASSRQGTWRLSSRDVLYIEVRGHWLQLHTYDASASMLGTLSAMEKQLAGQPFARCSESYLVNMEQIDHLEGDQVVMSNKEELPVSRNRRKRFQEEFFRYLGGL